jgi:endonuclease III
MEKEEKKHTRSKPTLSVTVDEVVSSNIKRARRYETTAISPVRKPPKPIKAEPTLSPSTQSICLEATVDVSARLSPTPAECHLIVHELGKLHPDVMSNNDERRGAWAIQRQQAYGSRSVATKKKSEKFPITDAIISTMLSQNTTAANQDRAFASLKKAFPGGWDQVAGELNTSRIEDAIRVAGLAQVRAERLLSMLQVILSERGEANFEYLQNIHSTDDIVQELSRFKGMGPKTISCVLLFALGRPDFPVDTHVLRISKQMGWIPQSYSREAAYQYLNNLIPDECKLDLHCLLVSHGKQCNKCAARGRAQFPPTKQWVCPMAAIKNSKLVPGNIHANVSTGDLKPTAAEKGHHFRSTYLSKTVQPEPARSSSNSEIHVKVEAVTSDVMAVKETSIPPA